MTQATDCRIYVACLASYNAGKLHGVWIDLDGKEESEVWNDINAMLAKSTEPNVTRQKCNDCGHHQDARKDDACDVCGGELSKPFASAEEWAIHDHEGFGNLLTGESADIGELCESAEILCGDDEAKIRGLLYLDWEGRTLREAIDGCEDVMTRELGMMENMGDVAAEWFQECYSEALAAMPDIFRNNIDWSAIAHDLEQSGEWREVSTRGERFAVLNANNA